MENKHKIHLLANCPFSGLVLCIWVTPVTPDCTDGLASLTPDDLSLTTESSLHADLPSGELATEMEERKEFR